MGGGDLNSKKSWHPNTMKNQERVWKAEQLAAEEKKRILELQQERAQEKDRQELNELARKNAGNSGDNRLDWMYNKPNKQQQQEDYLLGKKIDKNFEESYKTDQDEIPAVARRVVGSSMLSSPMNDVQVDLARKLREDPLLLVKERERAARAALLNNPVQRKRLAELLRKEQEQKKAQKDKKKHKKKGKDLDNLLAAKLNALSSNKVDLAKLLESDDSSDTDSSDEQNKKKKKKKKKKHKNKEGKTKTKEHQEKKSSSTKHKKSKEASDSDSSDVSTRKHSAKRKSSISEDEAVTPKKKHKKYHNISKHDKSEKKHENSSSDEHTEKSKSRKRNRDDSTRKESSKTSLDRDRVTHRRYNENTRDQNAIMSSNSYKSRNEYERPHREHVKSDDTRKGSKRSALSEEEKAAKLAEMMAAGAEREIQRGRRVAAQLAENSASEKQSLSRIPSGSEARALPESLESRIHSNRHNIQRDKRSMNENFAKR